MNAQETEHLWKSFQSARTLGERSGFFFHVPAEDDVSPDDPALGWKVAEWAAKASPRQRNKLANAASKPCYRWVWHAEAWLKSGRRSVRNFREQDIVARASRFHMEPSQAMIFKASLFAADASVKKVAEKLSIGEPEVVRAFHDLFFNVTDRKEDLAYRKSIVQSAKRGGKKFRDWLLPRNGFAELLEEGLVGSLDAVLSMAGVVWESEGDLLARLRRRSLRALVDPDAAPPFGVPSSTLEKIGAAILRGLPAEESEQGSTGSLEDPFLNHLLQDSKAYNDHLRRKKKEQEDGREDADL